MTGTARIAAALFYAALAAFATPALAGGLAEALSAERGGDMRKLVVHEAPRGPYAEPFTAADGREMRLADLSGRIVVLNFWATWCAPCREEMPALNALQHDLGGPGFAVVTIATGRNNPSAMKSFFAEHHIDALPLHADPRSKLAREAGVLGLPATLILDREGREIARLTGGADWAAEDAKSLMRALISASGS